MKKTKIGKVDYSNLGIPPEKHERETAKYFAKYGFDVFFIKPSSQLGSNSADFIMDNKIWEIKSPVVYGKSSFEYNFKKAMRQSEHIIYDLRRLKMADENKYIKELRKRSDSYKVKTLVIVTRDGRILTVKGKFSIM